ncbi:helix-hairpin-helix domain-containing protein [bacterium]|nr:helix-hairpin-helix domain-containing protein [bacterium]
MVAVLWILLFFGTTVAAASPLEDYLEGDTETGERSAAIEEQLSAPLDLNQVSREELFSLPWLTRSAAAAILRERSRLGGFRDFGQLEGIPEVPKEEIALLRQLSTIGAPPDHPFHGNARISGSGQHGHAEPLVPQQLSGESLARFHTESGAHGFVLSRHPSESPAFSEFTSAGLEFRWPSMRLLLGDYQAEFGTGLVFAASWGQAGWTRDALRVTPPDPRGLYNAPTTSPLVYYRGAALEYHRKQLSASFLLSSRDLAAILEDGQPAQLYRYSLASSALLDARSGQIREETAGISLSASRGNWDVGLNGVAFRYSPGLVKAPTPETPEPLTGNLLRLGSVYWSWALEGLVIRSELAGSSPGGKAFQSAVSFNAGRMGVAFFAAHADADFHSPRSRAWDEFDAEAGNSQTVGTLLRLNLANHLLTLRAASSATPFRTATSLLSQHSSEIDARWRATWRIIGFEVRGERDIRESSGGDGSSFPVEITGARFSLRIQSAFELRFYSQYRRAQSEQSGHSGVGTLSFVQLSQKLRRWSWFARLTIFHVTNSEAALTVYENNLRGSYPLVSCFGEGSRKMLLVSRRFGQFHLGAKIARTDKTEFDAFVWDWQFALQGEVRW